MLISYGRQRQKSWARARKLAGLKTELTWSWSHPRLTAEANLQTFISSNLSRWAVGAGGAGVDRTGGVERRNKAKWDSGALGDHRADSCVPLSSKAWIYEVLLFLLFHGSSLQNKIASSHSHNHHADRAGISIKAQLAVPLRSAG